MISAPVAAATGQILSEDVSQPLKERMATVDKNTESAHSLGVVG
jgi:hypothetical protein